MEESRERLLDILVSHGADVDAKDEDGRTPLHLAVLLNDSNAVKSLVSRGADIHAQTNDGKTPIYLAEEKENTEVATLLVKQECGGKISGGCELEENNTTDTVDSTNKYDNDHSDSDGEESLDQETITKIKSYLHQANRLINKALRMLEDR